MAVASPPQLPTHQESGLLDAGDVICPMEAKELLRHATGEE